MRKMNKHLIAAGLAAALVAAPFAHVAAQSADASVRSDQNQTVPGKANDAWITTKVKSELATTRNVHATDIDVDTQDGQVRLTGTVPDAQAMADAQRVAQSVKGVKSVDTSGLTVTGMNSTAQTGAGYDNSTAGTTAAQSQGGNRTMIGHVDDGWITTKVKSELATADNIKATDINVDTNQGRVRLTGTVVDAQALAKARQLAQSVKGVQSVDTSGLTITNQRRTADRDSGL